MLTVNVDVPEPLGIEGGTNAHVGGEVTTGVMLLHDRFTGPANPLRAVMVIVEVADPPAATEAGEKADAAIV